MVHICVGRENQFPGTTWMHAMKPNPEVSLISIGPQVDTLPLYTIWYTWGCWPRPTPFHKCLSILTGLRFLMLSMHVSNAKDHMHLVISPKVHNALDVHTLSLSNVVGDVFLYVYFIPYCHHHGPGTHKYLYLLWRSIPLLQEYTFKSKLCAGYSKWHHLEVGSLLTPGF